MGIPDSIFSSFSLIWYLPLSSLPGLLLDPHPPSSLPSSLLLHSFLLPPASIRSLSSFPLSIHLCICPFTIYASNSIHSHIYPSVLPPVPSYCLPISPFTYSNHWILCPNIMTEPRKRHVCVENLQLIITRFTIYSLWTEQEHVVSKRWGYSWLP